MNQGSEVASNLPIILYWHGSQNRESSREYLRCKPTILMGLSVSVHGQNCNLVGMGGIAAQNHKNGGILRFCHFRFWIS